MIDLGKFCGLHENHAHELHAYCWHCDRWTVLDLAAMIRAGQGIAAAAASRAMSNVRPTGTGTGSSLMPTRSPTWGMPPPTLR